MCLMCGQPSFACAPAQPAGYATAASEEFPAAASEIEALLFSATPGWNLANGVSQVVSFSFAQTAPEARSFIPGGWQVFSDTQMASARTALSRWGDVSGLVFVEVPDPGTGTTVDIRFNMVDFSDTAAGRGSYPGSGDIWINRGYYGGVPMGLGTYAFEVLMHEVGHAIGFKHSFEGGVTLSTALDNNTRTVMSYTDITRVTDIGDIDRMAVSYVYGSQAAESAWVRGARWDNGWAAIKQDGTGGAELIRGTTGRDAIFGGGGNDTINGAGGVDRLDGGPGNDRITLGATNGGQAYGDTGNDTLLGGAGDDWLAGGAGTNTVTGDWGVDTVVIDGARRVSTVNRSSDYSFTYNGETHQALRGTATSPRESLTFSAVENIGFTDGTLVFDKSDPAMQVARLYQAALNRAPDSVGLNYWIDALANGTSLNDVARGFVASTEFSLRFGAPTNEGYVTQLYANVLQRAPDAAGLRGWSDQLAAGTGREVVLTGFSESAENKVRTAATYVNGLWDQDDSAASIARLYYTTLGRRPEEVGLAGWEDASRGGMGLNVMVTGFTASSEFAARYGTPDPAAFVTLLYQNALGRAPEAAGLSGWVDLLATGAMDRNSVVLGFSESMELRINTQSWIEGGIVFA